MSEASVMWTLWSVIAAADVFVVAYFIRTVREGRKSRS